MYLPRLAHSHTRISCLGRLSGRYVAELRANGVDGYSLDQCKRDYNVGLLLAFATFLLGAGDDSFEQDYRPQDDNQGMLVRKSSEQQEDHGSRMHLVHSIGLGRLGCALQSQCSDAVHEAVQRATTVRAGTKAGL